MLFLLIGRYLPSRSFAVPHDSTESYAPRVHTHMHACVHTRSERQRARQNFLRGDTRVFIVYAKGTHSRNARETQHGRLAQDESEFLAGVRTTTAACTPSPFLSSRPFLSPSLSAFSRRAFKECTHSRASVLLSRPCTYTHERETIYLRFCTMLLLSLRRFLAFSQRSFSLAVRSYVCLVRFFHFSSFRA